jgi:hypothetical protein
MSKFEKKVSTIKEKQTHALSSPKCLIIQEKIKKPYIIRVTCVHEYNNVLKSEGIKKCIKCDKKYIKYLNKIN